MGFQIRNGLILSIVVACAAAVQLAAPAPVPDPMNQAAEEYVKLALALGQHDPDYVDAYYGPAEWKSQAETNKRPLTAIADEAAKLRDRIGALTPSNDEMMRLRREYLTKQLGALAARVEIVRGKRMTFDDESRALYDAVAPTFPLDHYEKLLADIGTTGALKPAGASDGRSLSQRYDDWHNGFIVPKEKLDTVFQCAIKECRVRTLAHLSLPPNESFTVEYVTHKPWGGYNWYKGNYQSVIQINTDLPVYIERAVDLAAHEGYPGHHVYNTLLEKNLTRGRGWVEFSCLPLYAPQALVSEGTANFGRDVVFTKEERLQFEKKVLWPAAGLDPDKAEQYYALQDLLKNLAYSRNEAARALLDGKIDAAAAQAWLEKYGLLSPGLAGKAVEFIEHYRSYVINYNYGEDLVRHYIEQQGGTADQPARRWKEFGSLLSSPRLPSGLQ